MADTGKYAELDENGVPQKITTSKPERGIQLQAPGAPEDDLVKAHTKAVEDAIKENGGSKAAVSK